MPELPPGFRSRLLTEADIPACVRLVVDNFRLDAQGVERWFEQRICHNPWQHALPGLGVGIERNGELVGTRAMFAQPWWIAGRPTVVAFAAHTAVDPGCRGFGLATALIAHGQAFAPITGSTSAGDITQKAYARLHYIPIGGADNDFFRLRISLRGALTKRVGAGLAGWLSRAFDRSLLPMRLRRPSRDGWVLADVARCGGEFDALWTEGRTAWHSCLQRDSAYLNWRLFDSPTAALKLAALRDDNGRLRGYGIWHEQSFDSAVRMAVLRDLFCDTPDPELPVMLLAQLIARWREAGLSWASLEVSGGSITDAFRALGLEHVPSKGNRYQMHSSEPLGQDVLCGWYRSALDGDYFDLP